MTCNIIPPNFFKGIILTLEMLTLCPPLHQPTQKITLYSYARLQSHSTCSSVVGLATCTSTVPHLLRLPWLYKYVPYYSVHASPAAALCKHHSSPKLQLRAFPRRLLLRARTRIQQPRQGPPSLAAASSKSDLWPAVPRRERHSVKCVCL